MKTKVTRTEQLELPFNPPVQRFEPVTGKSGIKRWYYVAKTYSQVMLAMGKNGDWEWIPHDCVRETPHLFSSRQLAKDIAVKHRHAVVETYLWSVPTPHGRG